MLKFSKKSTNKCSNIFVALKTNKYLTNDYYCQQTIEYILISKYLLHTVYEMPEKGNEEEEKWQKGKKGYEEEGTDQQARDEEELRGGRGERGR